MARKEYSFTPLEAAWARYFDALGIGWNYDKPWFKLPRYNLWLRAQDAAPTFDEQAALRRLVATRHVCASIVSQAPMDTHNVLFLECDRCGEITLLATADYGRGGTALCAPCGHRKPQTLIVSKRIVRAWEAARVYEEVRYA